MRYILRSLLAFLALAILFTTGCATAPKPQTPFMPGTTVETLTSAISLSVKTSERSFGGNGFLVYRRPDQFHMVILAPFGTTVLEFFALGDKVTVLVPSRRAAYVGSLSDLPEKGGLQGWRMMRWVVEGDPSYLPENGGSKERVDATGRKTVATYGPDGLLERKQSDDEVAVYRDYLSVDGVPFPSVIELTDSRGTKVAITFDEPEVNRPVDDSALTPHLEGLTILPLARLEMGNPAAGK